MNFTKMSENLSFNVTLYIEGYKIKEQPTKGIAEFTKQISGIANSINQIAKAVNTVGYTRDEDFEYIKNTIPRFILDFQKRLYSRGGDSIGSDKNQKY